MFGKKKVKYIAVFVQEEQKTYEEIKRKRFKPDIKLIQYKKGKSKEIDATKPTYRKGLKRFYFIDINHHQLNFKNNPRETINPELLDMVMKQGIIRQLTANLNEKLFKGSLMLYVILIVLGALMGYIIRGFI